MRADQRAITQASRQSWREPACRASAARCVIKLTNKSKSARPKTIRNHTQLIIREGFTFIYFLSLYDTRHFFLSVLSPPYIFARCNHAAFGLFPWSMELLAFASRQFAATVNVDLQIVSSLYSRGLVLLVRLDRYSSNDFITVHVGVFYASQFGRLAHRPKLVRHRILRSSELGHRRCAVSSCILCMYLIMQPVDGSQEYTAQVYLALRSVGRSPCVVRPSNDGDQIRSLAALS